MDYPLLIFTLIVFVAGWMGGGWEYGRLTRNWPEAGINDFHRKPGKVRFVVLVLVALAGITLYCAFNRACLWGMPDWLDISLLYWANGFGAALFGLLFGLALGAFRREKLPNGRALIMTALLCGAGLMVNT